MRVSIVLCVVGVLGVLGCASKPQPTQLPEGAIAIAVTEKGFEPAVVRVPMGKPVTLVVTRKTDKTCATEFVIAAENIKQDLPLDRAVEISFTPKRAGEIRYACGMDMVSGKVIVE